MRRPVIAVALTAVVILSASGLADVPEFMSYQGILRDSFGEPVPNDLYSLTFRLYDVETGGTALWTEVQAVDVEAGVVNAKLGKITPLTALEFDVPYWLGISIEAEPELAPRTELATVPYAGHAAYADHCLEGDDDWTFNGDDIYRDVGNVGIGVSVPSARLDVLAGDAKAAYFENGSEAGNFTVLARNNGGSAGGFYSGPVPSPYPGTPGAVFGFGGIGYRGGFFVSQGDEEGLIAQSQGAGHALHGWAFGTGYSGYFTGGQGVYCDDQIETSGFKMPTGAGHGLVLTSDASGVGTWQAGGGAGDITAVYADDGLYGGATSGDAHLSIGEGVGIAVTADAIALTTPYSSGSAYDARFVNELQASSVNSSMIQNGQVRFEDMQNVFDIGSNSWYWSQSTGYYEIDHTGATYPVMQIKNETDATDGDCLYVSSMGSGAASTTYAFFSSTYNGRAGHFTKFTDDNQYSVRINGASSTSEGLYVSGTIVSTVPFVRSVPTSRGNEPVFGVDSPEPEVVASGRARLSGGRALVPFGRMFTESVSRDADVRVTVTPIGGWSALFIERTGPGGFEVGSADGETEIDFYWTAVGKSGERTDYAGIALPDPEEERRIEAAKTAGRR